MNLSFNEIQNAYLSSQEKIRGLFKYPIQPDWEKLCECVLNRHKNKEFLDILIQQNRAVEDQAVKKNLELLNLPNTVIVITGQQLGLFVSPLYTVYKTLTTILLSDKLNKEYKKYHFLPVFWLEGEDHDFAEVNHAHFFDQSGGVFTVEHPEDDKDSGRSVSKRRLSITIKELLQTVRSGFHETEFTGSLFEKLEQDYQENGAWISAFANQITDIFSGTGLLLYNPAEERVKKYSAEFFMNLIVQNEAVTDAFARQTKHLPELGFNSQVPFDEGKSYMFISENDGPRRHLLKGEKGHFHFKGSGKTFSRDQLLELAKSHPEWFSSTVLTRPIWQSWMLPVVSYVAGPAEIAYWAQLGPAFEVLDVEMPHLKPRLTLTLLEPKIQRLLNKYAIELSALQPNKDEFIREQIKRLQLSDLEHDFKEILSKISESEKKVQGSVKTIDPTLENLVAKTYESAASAIAKLENRILKRLEEKNELLARHLNEIHSGVFPDGHLQERYIGSLYYLNKYGPAWLKTITERIDPDNDAHQVVEL